MRTVVKGLRCRDKGTLAYFAYLKANDQQVELIPQPSNKYDADAIGVYVHGLHIGYVPRGRTLCVKSFLKKNKNAIIVIKPNKKYPDSPILQVG